CTATGEPKPRILWRLPSKALADQWHRMGSRIRVYPNGSLAVEAVTEKDAGDYLCVARNKIGDDLILMKVSVAMKPARIDQKQYFKKVVPYGKDFKVDCKASGSPAPEISWSLPDGTVINNAMLADDSGRRSRRHLLHANGSLSVAGVKLSDAGEYTCVARNPGGDDTKLYKLDVVAKPPPSILARPTGPVTGVSGEPLSLPCSSDGSPKPRTAWTLPGGYVLDRPQINGKHILLENGTLVIREATIHDRGDYVCKAHNSAGESSVTIPVVIVAYPPRITNRPPRAMHTLPGAAVQLHCAALGMPSPEITWELPDRSVL
ncbi:Immunoglobulin superfamily member 10, partial [Eurypyga helias]